MNCGMNNYVKDDHRSYRRNFCSCEKKYVFINLKKVAHFTGHAEPASNQ